MTKKDIKKRLKGLKPIEKDFIQKMNNYALALVLGNKQQEINELCEIIRIQNERRSPK